MSRRDNILSLFDASGFGLEIGPSYNPLLPKADGYRVETLDYADQATLQRKYDRDPTVDTSRIEPVDFVSDGRPMRDVIGKVAAYDFILASHVIEHTPDMLGFLQDCETLLKPDGVLVLAVPDKRCCFDVFQRLTSTGEVLDAHDVGRRRPGLGSVFDAAAYGAKKDGAPGWPLGSDGDRRLSRPVAEAWHVARHAHESPRYTDVHVWRFVPSSFALIVHDLHEIGEIGLRLVDLRPTDEFFAVLSTTGDGLGWTRQDMIEASFREHAHDYVLATERTQEKRWAGEREALTQAVEDMRHEADRLKLELDIAREEVAALRASTSWRLTRPLRALRERISS